MALSRNEPSSRGEERHENFCGLSNEDERARMDREESVCDPASRARSRDTRIFLLFLSYFSRLGVAPERAMTDAGGEISRTGTTSNEPGSTSVLRFLRLVPYVQCLGNWLAAVSVSSSPNTCRECVTSAAERREKITRDRSIDIRGMTDNVRHFLYLPHLYNVIFYFKTHLFIHIFYVFMCFLLLFLDVIVGTIFFHFFF